MRVHPDWRVHFKKKIKPISDRNFQLKMVPLDAECFKPLGYMFFCPKSYFVASSGGPKVGSRENLTRKSTMFFVINRPCTIICSSKLENYIIL